MQTRQRVALQEARPASCIHAEIDARKIAAPEPPVGVQGMRTNLLELCWLKPRRHMVAHQTPEVALGFEGVEERLAAILGGRGLRQTAQRGLAPPASQARGGIDDSGEVLYPDGLRRSRS